MRADCVQVGVPTGCPMLFALHDIKDSTSVREENGNM
jgi:hypothetical protein